MIKLKEFSAKKIILTDGTCDFEQTCQNENEEFLQDIIEDILSYPERTSNETTQ